MVIIYGGVAVDQASVDDVAAAAATFQAKCRQEDGCVDYTLAWEVGEPNRIRLLEAWASEDDYERHKAQDHVKEWTAFVGRLALEPPAFTRNDLPERAI